MTTNAQHLQWIYNRLIGVHKEDLAIDYMVRFRKIIKEIDGPILNPCIPVENLFQGSAYEVDARNFEIAIWDGQEFFGVRSKFQDTFLDGEIHVDQGGTCRPLRILS